MLAIMPRETHRLVAIEDVDYVQGIAERLSHSGDPEERIAGTAALYGLRRLSLIEKGPRKRQLP